MAELIPPSEVSLKHLISSYPYLKDTSPSSWFVWSDTGDPPLIMKTQSVCHADMRYHGAGYDHLVTAVPKKDRLGLKYIRMLLAGPFRAFSDLISLKQLKDDYYLQVDGLDKWPANVLFNFCIASRAPIEFDHLFERWDVLCHAGYPEMLAWLLSYSTGGKSFKGSREFPQQNHFFIDPATNWRNVLAGTPNLAGSPFKTAPLGITPSNVIWGLSQDHHKISVMTDEKIAAYFDLKIVEKPKKTTKQGWDEPGQINIYKQFIINQQAAMNQGFNQIHDAAIIQAGQAPPLNWVNAGALGVPPAAAPQPEQPDEDDFAHDDNDFELFEDDDF